MPSRIDAGFRQGWLIFALAASAFWLSFFHRVAPAAIADELQRSFVIGGAMLGALAATYYVIYTLMQVPTGVLNDTVGPRRVLAAGCLVAGIGSLLFASADSVAAAIIGRALAGLGVSVAFVSMLKLAAEWFPENRFATITGIGAMIGLTGALAAAAPLAWAVTLVSWRVVFTAAGAASLLLGVAIALIVRDRPAGPAAERRATPGSPLRWREGLDLVARSPGTWPCFWFGFGMSGSYMTFVSLWAVPYFVHGYGMSAIEATQHTSVMLVCLALSQGVIGALSDRVGRRRPLIVGSALAYLACWAAWLAGAASLPGAGYAVSAVMGLSVCGMTLSWACAKELNPPRYSGIAISLVNTSGFLAVGLLQPLVGWLVDRGAAGAVHSAATYLPGMVLLTAFAGIAVAAALFVPETHCRNIWIDRERRGAA
ncbi:MAG TPA: MFS transporter [Burkholderiales bacterium]|nr:MFS transporter [Burkholderiales bacterium]